MPNVTGGRVLRLSVMDVCDSSGWISSFSCHSYGALLSFVCHVVSLWATFFSPQSFSYTCFTFGDTVCEDSNAKQCLGTEDKLAPDMLGVVQVSLHQDNAPGISCQRLPKIPCSAVLPCWKLWPDEAVAIACHCEGSWLGPRTSPFLPCQTSAGNQGNSWDGTEKGSLALTVMTGLCDDYITVISPNQIPTFSFP